MKISYSVCLEVDLLSTVLNQNWVVCLGYGCCG